MASSISITLSKGDWAEIYYALESKAQAIKDGYYGAELKRGEDKEWISHLKMIMEEINGEVDV